MTPPLFRLEAVELERGGTSVLHGVDAELPVGTSCIWGRSGSGKSSLLRLLTRLADPSAGRILLHGEDVRTLEPLALRRRVALVPQLPALVGSTVAENVLYGSRLAGKSAELEYLLDLVDLDPGLGGHEAARLSVGQQQRLVLARALAVEPEVLLLDEPTSALDGRSRDAVEQTLAHLSDALNVSIVVVTHDCAQAARLADWFVELDGGNVVRSGRSAKLLSV